MKLFLDAGHGLGNRTPGVMDPGAMGNGTSEHAEVEKLRTEIIARVGNRVTIVAVPNDGFTLQQKGNFLVQNFAEGDVFLSLHMNSSEPTGTGSEVLFDDAKPQHRKAADAMALDYATAMGLKNRGAKPDTESHEGNVFLLGKFPGPGFLLETGFISLASDLEIVRTKATAVISDLIVARFGVVVVGGQELEAARSRMIELGVFTEDVPRGQTVTTDELALFLARFRGPS
ncbi:MAG TPA: N-acetylmuramoyl-L-alanine amidase [Thermoanaerobaculia bacterium]|jgi:N-acetylmuramoyl-L-alanine amidase|nr:N-acetylmuramoyl-L-alanine amidase [Thermoanaerobaculia bacterium]